MGNGYGPVPADDLEAFRLNLQKIMDRLAELERPTGTQLSQTVQKLQQLVHGLLSQTDINVTGNATIGGNETVGGTLNVTGASYFPQAYANPVTTGTYYAAYLNGGDYRLGRTASSRRYKQDISTMPVPEQAILALRIVQFRWKAEVEAGRDQGYDFGVVAEELHELGLTPWVFYNEDGEPEGVHYERLFLAALPLIQRLATDLDTIRHDTDDIRRRLDAAGL